MPATAGRVRMPANNRVYSSAALQTHGIWQSAIGYDPYAPMKDDSKVTSQGKSEEEPDNPYESFKGLILLARMTASNTDETWGSCRKCGRGGHLTYQCRNFLSVKDDEKDMEAIDADIMAELGKIKGSMEKFNGKAGAESLEESSEETESSDSSEDSELERAVAERFGKKKAGSKLKSSKKKGQSDDSDSRRRKKRGRSKKRRGGKRSESDLDDDDGRGKRRKEKRRRDESSDDEERLRHRRKSRKEKRRRRRHEYSDDSEDSEESPRWHKRKSRRARYDSDVNDR